MLFWNKICGFTVIFFLCAIFSTAQSPYNIKLSGIQLLKKQDNPTSSLLNKTGKKENPNPFSIYPVIPQNYYTQHFGVMCKKELVIEKATGIPFRFRLGSIQQCNYLEGKK
jgi:hypothetical protein